ncbi:MAG: CPBP family intramembrane glutamic endopeptidase [Candidatus Acidiferrales bacterium]
MSDSIASPSPVAPGPPPGAARNIVFFGPNGLRAGWRLLIFFAILFAIGGTGVAIARAVARAHPSPPGGGGGGSAVSVFFSTISELVVFLVLLFVTWIMAKIEKRKIADYGLPARRAFRAPFWQGAVIGFVALSVLLLVLRMAGVFYFGPLSLHGFEILKYGFVWGLAFLFVGFFEEFSFRGYMLFTLSTGIGFWPAAIILSFLFGFAHHFNPGETFLGCFSAGSFGFLFCLLLRRTGDLWMAIGFHMSWDWAESYFYGVADSGQVAQGHLLNASFHGPVWLTGGTVGPEGSWICLAVLVVLWLVFSLRLRGAKYPNPAAIPDPRRLR